uniref:Uncharacterized protein n=1 Tax=Phytophthora fragariae TaxID=53985 RepID=A0A6A3DA67_9STRA|nr:hypothetical protein PF009_g32596 [Phytophthora fragariae]
MADILANLAMDAKKSIQVTASEISKLPTHWTTVVESLPGDIEHWLDNLPDMEAPGRAFTNIGAFK